MTEFGENPDDYLKYSKGDPVWMHDADETQEYEGVIHHVDDDDPSLPWAISKVDHNGNTWDDDWGWYSDDQVRPRSVQFIIVEERDLVD